MQDRKKGCIKEMWFANFMVHRLKYLQTVQTRFGHSATAFRRDETGISPEGPCVRDGMEWTGGSFVLYTAAHRGPGPAQQLQSTNG